MTDARLFPLPDVYQAGGWATLHRQTTIAVNGFTAQVDHELAPLISQLWLRELWTLESCQDKDGYVFLAFLSLDEARCFCRAVLDWAATQGEEGLAARVGWAGAPYERDAPALPGRPWKYIRLPYLDPDEDGLPNDEEAPLVLVDECVCVEFPRGDLANVLEAVCQFDGRKVVQQVMRGPMPAVVVSGWVVARRSGRVWLSSRWPDADGDLSPEVAVRLAGALLRAAADSRHCPGPP